MSIFTYLSIFVYNLSLCDLFNSCYYPSTEPLSHYPSLLSVSDLELSQSLSQSQNVQVIVINMIMWVLSTIQPLRSSFAPSSSLKQLLLVDTSLHRSIINMINVIELYLFYVIELHLFSSGMVHAGSHLSHHTFSYLSLSLAFSLFLLSISVSLSPHALTLLSLSLSFSPSSHPSL